MQRSRWTSAVCALTAAALVLTGCGRDDSGSGGKGKAGEPAKVPGFDGSTIKLGALVPQSGPVKVVGDPILAGNRAFWEALNAKGGIAGKYKVELDVRDNKYTPQETVIQYGAIKNQVVAFQQILGTAPLQGVQAQLARDGGFSFAGTLDAIWHKDPHLLALFAPYQIQAANGISYYVNEMGGKGKPVCTLTADNSFGNAGLDGAAHAAKELGITYKAQAKFTSGQSDFGSQVDQLKKAGCAAVWLGAVPSDTAAILAKAAQNGFDTQWIGTAVSYSASFAGTALAPYLEKNFIAAIEGVAWGDRSVPEMKLFTDAIAKYAPQQKPDHQALSAWLQASALSQILTKAVELGDLSKPGILAAAAATKTINMGGIVKDQKYGTPAEREPSRYTTMFKITPETLATNAGLAVLAPNAVNFSSPAAKSYKFDLG
ncbi:ABC transporter substrate-binding protein [Actinomadura sp. WMMB 499]|uniref:ABC transporter substrate-binding protein n=1 Tax=Actinomadura sp. WMMB 499 TaxID=1219491 RepID=UPI001245DCAD|nr:ABC transporter substrate-binding protein [Actinomadura sp. WMMB 499]QFG22173.1 ABC transporter substrate-binding protein [Actinomadura sp. WMMB 499]